MARKLIAPSILSADFANLERDIVDVLESGADWVHVDVMDGNFVPNLTIGASVVKSLRKTSSLSKAFLDCHLMVNEPEKYIEDFSKAGADSITIHVESTKDPRKVLQEIKKLGMKAGITLCPPTPVEEILPLLSEVDLVLIMTVNPGFSGQSFMAEQMEKVSVVREELKKINSSALIQLDGGVSDKTIGQCQEADVLVTGSFLFNKNGKEEYKKAIDLLKGRS